MSRPQVADRTTAVGGGRDVVGGERVASGPGPAAQGAHRGVAQDPAALGLVLGAVSVAAAGVAPGLELDLVGGASPGAGGDEDGAPGAGAGLGVGETGAGDRRLAA
jgi:hypothetical protein